MVGGNSALLLLIKDSKNDEENNENSAKNSKENEESKENKDLCPLLEQRVKVDLIINLSFLKCLKEAPKKESKENYGLCIESSTIDLSFCKELDNKIVENSCPEIDKKECSEALEKCGKALVDKLNKYIDFIERL